MLLKVINVSSVMCVSLASFIIEEENQSFFFLLEDTRLTIASTRYQFGVSERRRDDMREEKVRQGAAYSVEAKYVFISVYIRTTMWYLMMIINLMPFE